MKSHRFSKSWISGSVHANRERRPGLAPLVGVETHEGQHAARRQRPAGLLDELRRQVEMRNDRIRTAVNVARGQAGELQLLGVSDEELDVPQTRGLRPATRLVDGSGIDVDADDAPQWGASASRPRPVPTSSTSSLPRGSVSREVAGRWG